MTNDELIAAYSAALGIKPPAPQFRGCSESVSGNEMEESEEQDGE